VKLPEVASVEADQDRLVVFPRAGQSLFVPVNELIQKFGWQVEELHVERGRLDEVFRTITREVA